MKHSFHRKKTVFLLVVSFFATLQVLPAAENNLANNDDFQGKTLETYLQQALEANPGLATFQHRYDAARQRIPQLSALPDPMVQVTHFVESVQTRTGPQENVIMLNQRLPWFGKLDQKQQVATAEAEMIGYAYRNQQLMLLREVGLEFYEYGYTRQAIELTRENLDLLQGLDPIVEARVKSGGDLNELLRLKVEVGKLNDRLQSMDQLRVTQSAKLKEQLALSGEALLPWPEWVKPDALHPDLESLRADLKTENPGLKILERKIEAAEARQKVARLESYPDLTVGVNYIQVGEPTGMASPMDAGKDAWGVTAAVNIPLWLGKNKAAREEALNGKRAAQTEYKDRLNTLNADLTAAFARLEDAQRRLDLYGGELLGLAHQAVENSRTSYETGHTGILEVIDSERTMLELQLLSERAGADAWKQRIILQTLANRPLAKLQQTNPTDAP